MKFDLPIGDDSASSLHGGVLTCAFKIKCSSSQKRCCEISSKMEIPVTFDSAGKVYYLWKVTASVLQRN